MSSLQRGMNSGVFGVCGALYVCMPQLLTTMPKGTWCALVIYLGVYSPGERKFKRKKPPKTSNATNMNSGVFGVCGALYVCIPQLLATAHVQRVLGVHYLGLSVSFDVYSPGVRKFKTTPKQGNLPKRKMQKICTIRNQRFAPRGILMLPKEFSAMLQWS